MFAYRAAVVVKNLGYSNIKIYNGGIRDWKKFGYPIESRKPLPQSKVSYISAKTLSSDLREFDKQACRDSKGNPLMTLLDFRISNHLVVDDSSLQIATKCPARKYLLDDILTEEVRAEIPKTGSVITITETGNRDEFIIRYLSQYGFTNIRALRFGVHGLLKQKYSTSK
ncbi:MAG: hypothetical protein WBB19_10795 [Desulforhopalus sp.]